LQHDLATLQAQLARLEQSGNLRLSRHEIVAHWPTLRRTQQGQIIAALVERIEAHPGATGSLDLHIHWRDGSTTTAQVRGRVGTSLRWTTKEDGLVIALFTQAASQLEIARALPDRTWTSIQQRYCTLVSPPDRIRVRRKPSLAPGETHADFVLRMNKDCQSNHADAFCPERLLQQPLNG
jgi:hypothetical protein